MGLAWLANQQWREVTREERHFCAELYGSVQLDVHRFVSFLETKCCPKVFVHRNWEIAYEVCFYRDLMHFRGETNSKFSSKRTFDLALFSDCEIVLFETKAHQAFDRKQLKSVRKDREQVAYCTDIPITNIHTAGIISSLYTPRDSTLGAFTLQPLITWKQLASLYRDKAAVFEHADEIYSD